MSEPTVTVVKDGQAYDVTPEQAAELRGQGFKIEGAEERVERVGADARKEHYSGSFDKKFDATVLAGLRGASLGGTDLAARGLGIEEDVRGLREENEGLSLAGEIVGGLATGKLPVPAGAAARLGSRIAQTAEGASALTKVARAGAGAAVESGIQGVGQTVTDLSLSQDPLTLERFAASLGSNVGTGALVGGAAGAVTKGAGIGLRKAKAALDDVTARASASPLSDDLAKLDGKGLRAAEKAELEAIETARVPQRQAIADELGALRKQQVDDSLFLVTKGATDRETKSIGKIWLEADKQVDRVLRNPKALASRPQRALDALQQQEHALEKVIAKTDDFKARFVADESGDRMAALSKMEGALERNRALQKQINEITSKPASDRLTAIADARDALDSGKGQRRSLAEDMLGGTIMGKVAGVFTGLPVLGPVIGAKAGRLVADAVFGKLGNASAEMAARGSKAIGTLLDVTGKIPPRTVPVLASKVLASVKFGDSEDPAPKPGKAKGTPAPTKLADSYIARTHELKSQTAYGPDGKAYMRPQAREKIYDQLAPVRALSPIAADRMETIQARKFEYLSNKIPRKPDPAAYQVGPDHWHPSEMQMREFARIVAAVEDPMSVVERLTDGTVTPEEAEAFREVYPEMYRDIQQQIMGELPKLQKTLPYKRRLALSIFSGVPVDPAMDPSILSVLQGQYALEPGTEGGTQAPKPQPAFGSVKAEQGTPAQRREEA